MTAPYVLVLCLALAGCGVTTAPEPCREIVFTNTLADTELPTISMAVCGPVRP